MRTRRTRSSRLAGRELDRPPVGRLHERAGHRWHPVEDLELDT